MFRGGIAPEADATRKFGQHFLIKGSVVERIARAVCPNGFEPLVIEIGPGRGVLTEKLLKRATRVIAIELDERLAEHLRRRFEGAPLEVLHQDVLETDLAQWGSVPIAGNLPYYITSPILDKVARTPFSRAVFLVQKEVAQRLVAHPGSRDYGFLTVRIALIAEARLLFEVKSSAFYPPPKVDSATVILEPRHPPAGIQDPEAFLKFVANCFHHKRKTIRNNLAVIYNSEEIQAWPEGNYRAEQLSLEEFASMYRRLSPEVSVVKKL